MPPWHASNPVDDRLRRSFRRHARAAFTLLETLIVLVLLLALAAIAIPAAAEWFSTRSDDQIRETVASIIRDQQLESMATRTPRVVWVAPVLSKRSSSGGSSKPSEAGRWGIGAEKIAAAETLGLADKPLRPLFELPAGWSVDLAPQDASTPSDGAASEQPEAPMPAESSTDRTDCILFWPHGQIDLPNPLVLVDPAGVAWRLSLNPWTGASSWSGTPPASSTADSARPAMKDESEDASP